MAELNQQQLAVGIKVALAAGGPIYNLALTKLHLTQGDYGLYADLASYLLPPIIVYGWAWWSNRRSAQVANVATFTPAQQAEALAKTPDAAKVLIAKAVPGVATIVVKNDAGNGVGKLAESVTQPDIVTEKQNAIDVKLGARAA